MPSALRFKRAGQGVRVVRTASLPAADSFTLMCWVYVRTLSPDTTTLNTALRIGPASGGTMTIIGQAGTGTPNGLLLFENNVSHVGTTMNANVWYHITLTATPNGGGQVNYVAYLNGVSDIVVSNSALVTVGSITFGDSYSDDPLDGDLSTIKLWNRPLSTDEIAAEIPYAVAISRGGLIGEYPLPNQWDFVSYEIKGPPRALGQSAFANSGPSWELQDFSGFPSANEITCEFTSANVEDLDVVCGPPIQFAPSWSRFRARYHVEAAGGGTAFTQSLGGTLTSAGGLVKAISLPKSGSLSSSGQAIQKTLTTKAGTLTSSGAMVRQTKLSKSGTLTSSGFFKSAVAKGLSGTLSSSGALAKKISKTLTGAMTSSGALTLLRVIIMTLGGTLSSSGILSRKTTKGLSGVLTPTGTVRFAIAWTLRGTLASSGALAKQTQKALGGALTMSGALRKFIGKILRGTLTSLGIVTRQSSVVTPSVLTVLSNVHAMSPDLFAKSLEQTLTAKGEFTSSAKSLEQTLTVKPFP